MITREQFRLQIDRLTDTFGEKNFPDQRSAMIFDYVCGLEYETVIAIVDSFIRSSKYAPLPADFSEAVKEATKGVGAREHALGEIQPKEIARCWDCADSGFIRLQRIDSYEAWAKFETGSAPCHCSRGKELILKAKQKAKNPTELGPQFNDDWKKIYKIMPEYENDDRS